MRALDAGRRLELRGAERTSVSLVTQVLCYPAGGGFAIATATVRNVSISGMLLETPQELHAGDRVRVDLPLCEGRYPLPIGGTVVRVMTASLKSGVHWFVGCRIDGLDTAGSDGLPRPYRSCLPSM